MPKLIIIIGEDTSQTDVETALAIGMLPPVRVEAVDNIPNGAGFGAASFLSNGAFARAIRIVQTAEQIDLDTNAEFVNRFIDRLTLMP